MLAFVPGVAVGAFLLVVALVRWDQALGWALGLCGATYVAEVAVRGGGVDSTAPLVAVLLLLSGELTAWSLAERGRLRVDGAVHGTRALTVATLAIVGLLAAGLVVALGGVQLGGGIAWTALGAAAAVAAAGGAAVLARR